MKTAVASESGRRRLVLPVVILVVAANVVGLLAVMGAFSSTPQSWVVLVRDSRGTAVIACGDELIGSIEVKVQPAAGGKDHEATWSASVVIPRGRRRVPLDRTVAGLKYQGTPTPDGRATLLAVNDSDGKLLAITMLSIDLGQDGNPVVVREARRTGNPTTKAPKACRS